ncbi:MAG: hypothetical protein JWN99_2758 [Ilumatobacteraceae bacterium]|nr:hypothetical protein [Ilumatobacteraceae bacterium]
MAARQLANGSTVGIGSLPHRDLESALEFALDATTIPTIPTLPKRSPAEGMVVQAVLGIRGITVGQYGAISVDVSRMDPAAPVITDLTHDAFGAFRAFLGAAAGRLEIVKWQMVGPVTLGMALLRAGVPEDMAFEVSVRAVRAHLQHLLDAVDQAIPGCTQVVFIDEPDMADVTDASFPLAPDTAIDLVSGALAAIETRAVSGLHVCGDADWASLISAGPQILSIPVRESVLASAGYLQQFLARGGLIAWGAVLTDGPIATTVERPWRRLTELWCQLVERGCDPVMLRQQCLISPECGLGVHTPSVVERVHRIASELGRRVRDQATASRFVLGA